MNAAILRTMRETHWTRWLGILGLVSLFLALRWNNYNAPFIRDEGECDYAAQLLVQGVAPYLHAFIQKPPGVVYSYAVANLLLPGHFWAPRLLAYVFVAAATVLLGLIARLEFGKGYALPAMWLMTPMILLPGIDQYSCNPEMFMLLPLLATATVYSYSRGHGHKTGHWFAAGFLAAVTLIYKYTALPILSLVFLTWLVEMHLAGSKPKAMLSALACAAAGGILAAGLGLWFYAAHRALKSLWECTVLFNRYYVQSSGVFSLAFFCGEIKIFWDSWWILFLAPWAIFLKPRARLWFWAALFICALFSTSGNVYPQYYILMMPFWALLAAAGIAAFASKIAEWVGFPPKIRALNPRTKFHHGRFQQPAEDSPSPGGEGRDEGGLNRASLTFTFLSMVRKPMPWLTGWITAIVLLLVLIPDLPWMLFNHKQFSEAANHGYPFIEAQIVADKVARMSSPDDFVFVAGSDPEILCYAQRFSPTRFITSYPLMIPSPLAREYQEAAMQDLIRHPPKLIVFVAAPDSWIRHETSPSEFFEFLNNFLNRNYSVAGGYVKTNGSTGYWSDRITRETFQSSSLLVYQLKK